MVAQDYFWLSNFVLGNFKLNTTSVIVLDGLNRTTKMR